jgi:flagellar hook assembly protein FlgD
MKKIKNIFSAATFISIVVFFSFGYAIDNDNDGLDDSVEEEFLNMYVPKLIFHPEENERPRTVESLFDEYEFDLVARRVDFRVMIVPTSEFPFFRIHKVAVVKEERTIKRDIKLSDLKDYGEKLDKGWELMLVRRGRKNIFISFPPYSIYGHCFKTRDKQGTEYIELQYWIFYANNIIRDIPDIGVQVNINKEGNISFISEVKSFTSDEAENYTSLKRLFGIDHEGDWEFVAIRLLKDYPYKPQQIYYSAHYPINWTEDQIRLWEDVAKYDNTHPIVYVARDSHANYFSAGDHKSDIQYIDYEYIDRTGYGEATIPNVINLGEKDAPLNNCDWIKYVGKWGADNGSPKGPVYRDTGGIGSWDGMFYDCPGDVRNWVFFYSVSGGNVKIKIFDISNRLVREINLGHKEAGKEYEYQWDIKDNYGNTCELGIYLYQVFINDKLSKTGSIVVVDGITYYPQISYTVGYTKISIYNIAGELVRTLDEGLKPSGTCVAVWDAKNEAGEDVPYQPYIYLIKIDNIKIEEGKIAPSYLRPYIYDVSVSANSFSSGQKITLYYKLSEECKVFIKVIDAAGAVVRTLVNGEEWQKAGLQSAPWDGRKDNGQDAPTGTYTYVISAVDKSFKPAVEVKQEITWQVGEYTISYGPTPPIPRKGSISFTDTVSPVLTNVYHQPDILNMFVSTINVRSTISEDSIIELEIYNSEGVLIRKITKFSLKGDAEISWDGEDERGNKAGDGRYSYKVTAEDLSGNKSSEKIGYFTVDTTPPPAPKLLSPRNNSIVNAYPSFDWEDVIDVSGIGAYYFEMDDDINFGSPLISVEMRGEDITSDFSPPYNHEPIPHDGVWYWRVRAEDKAENVGSWSEVWTVTIDTVSPGISSTYQVSRKDGSWVDGVLWTNTKTPSLRVTVQDVLSGLDVNSAKYLYKTENSDWMPLLDGFEYTTDELA